MNRPMNVVVVGTGWRAEFYMRICRALPDLFRLAGIWYHSEKGRDSVRSWNVPLVSDLHEAIALKPDFAVVSVSGGAMVQTMEFFHKAGVPVLAETFTLPDEKAMNEMYACLKDARLQFAEQYIFQPLNAARYQLMKNGVLGKVYHVRMSIPTHHHPASLVRFFMESGDALPVISAKRYQHNCLKGPGRGGDPKGEEEFCAKHEIVTYDFGDRQAVNDFEDMQHRSFMRSNYFLVRGSRGEIVNEHAMYMLDALTPVEIDLKRVTAGAGVDLQGLFLRGVNGGQAGWLYQNPFMPARLYDDEIAVAECMRRMAEYVNGEEGFYGIKDVLTDIYYACLTGRALESGEAVQAERQSWM